MLLKINSLAIIEIAGADAKTFMQGQFTANLDKITPEQASLCGYCNAKGRLIGIFTLLATPENYYLIMPKDIAATFCKKLGRFAMFSKVTVKDVSEQVTLYGGDAEYIASQQIQPASSYQVQAVAGELMLWQGERVLIIDFANNNRRFDAQESNDQWLYYDIQAGIPQLCAETIEQYLAHPLNLVELGAISFDKGCFVGQEIIARTQYRGTVKKHLQRGQLQTRKIPQVGDALYYQGKSVGEIVNIAETQPEQYELLAILKDNIHQADSIHLADDEGQYFKLLDLPYPVKLSE